MQTRCERRGQIEVGIIEHEGREFAALRATVIGRNVTGYTRLGDGEIHLSTWCGQTMLVARSEVVERYWSGSLALILRLPRGRFICGYALADNGMLFRGELVTGDEDELPAGSWRCLSPLELTPRLVTMTNGYPRLGPTVPASLAAIRRSTELRPALRGRPHCPATSDADRADRCG